MDSQFVTHWGFKKSCDKVSDGLINGEQDYKTITYFDWSESVKDLLDTFKN